MLSPHADNILSNIYFDISHPASFSSHYKLYKAAKNKIPSLTLKNVKWWLSGKDAYRLHKPLKRKFQRRKTLAPGIDSFWQTDLAVFEGIARYNSGVKYLLVCIDVFSRFLIIEPLKKKDSSSVVKAFSKIFKTRVPSTLSSDEGREYLNKPLLDFLKKHNVKHFVHHSDTKAALAERVIRTVKERLFRYFTHKNTLRYVNVLQQLVHAYNNSVHSSINERPANVTKQNEMEIWKYQYGDYLRKTKHKDSFKTGDTVILSKIKKTFAKGYVPKWTKEQFTIVDKINTSPPVWRIMDKDNNILKGVLYAEEMQKVR